MARNRRTGTSLALLGTLGWACYGAGAFSLAQSGINNSGAAPQAESLFGDAPSAVNDGTGAEGQTVKVGDLGEIDLHVKDLEISKVLQLLSLQSQRNIVASRNVAGTISADLYGVDFYEALDAILHTNGFGYKEEGSFIYVYTQQELKEIAEVERKLEVKVVRLSYLTAADASTFVTPLLSDVGEISLSGEVPGGMQPSISDAGRNTNSLDEVMVVRDYAENLSQIASVISELDRRPVQVQIEATVMEASLSNNTGWGVDLSILADWELGSFENPLNVVDSVLTGDVVGGPADATKFDVLGTGAGWQTTVGNTVSGRSGIKFGVLSDHVAAFIRALDEVTDTTIIARPKLLVLNRQRADLLIGSKLGYISTTQTETSATQTVEFLDVGTQLTIRPFVSADEFIRLEVSPKVSNGSVSQLGNFIVPNETTNELVTNVVVRNGQTVVLGGMFKEDTTVSRAQVPGLGDVPLIGAALQGQDDIVDRSEVIFMITPTVVHDQYLSDVGRRAEDAVEMARLGTREEMLPYSREKLTAFHLRKAREHLDSGNTDRARWHLKLALTMDPTLQEARRMQENLDGERIWWPGRSMLEYAVDGAVDEHIKALPISAPAGTSSGKASGNQVELLIDSQQGSNPSQTAISFETDPFFETDPNTGVPVGFESELNWTQEPALESDTTSNSDADFKVPSSTQREDSFEQGSGSESNSLNRSNQFNNSSPFNDAGESGQFNESNQFESGNEASEWNSQPQPGTDAAVQVDQQWNPVTKPQTQQALRTTPATSTPTTSTPTTSTPGSASNGSSLNDPRVTPSSSSQNNERSLGWLGQRRTNASQAQTQTGSQTDSQANSQVNTKNKTTSQRTFGATTNRNTSSAAAGDFDQAVEVKTTEPSAGTGQVNP